MPEKRSRPTDPPRELLPEVNALFSRVRRGLRLRWALRGVEGAAAAGLLYGVAGLAADRLLSLSTSVRLAGLAGLAAVAGLVLVWKLAGSALGRIGPLYLAARVESRYPVFADRLISAVELASGGSEAEGPAELVYRQAEELARRAEPRKVVAVEAEPTSVHRWLVAAMAVTLIAAAVMRGGFPEHVTRCLFPWLDARESPDAVFIVSRSHERVREGERFFVWGRVVSVSGEEARRVTLEMAQRSNGALVGSRSSGAGSLEANMAEAGRLTSVIPMERSPGNVVWTAEVGPLGSSSSFRLRAEFAGGREDLLSERFEVTLLRAPRVGSVRLTYVYPAYAGQPPRRQEGGAVDALIGTKVTVEAAPNTPLSRATMRVAGGETIRMQRTRARARDASSSDGPAESPTRQSRYGDSATWEGSFTVRRSGSYEVALTSAQSVEGVPRAYPVIARSDSAPTCDAVYEERPAGEALARGARFRVRASDDLGLEELVLIVKRGVERGVERGEKGGGPAPGTRARAGSREVGSGRTFYYPVPGFERRKREADVAVAIPPQVMPLEPGVVYTYYVRAADGFVPDPHLATSAARTFRIARPKDEGLLARRRRRKRRPPLLEPRDDDLTESPKPPAGGSGSSPKTDSGEGDSGRSSERLRPPSDGPPPPSRRLAGLQDPPGGGAKPPPAAPPPDGPGEKGKRAKPSRYASGPGLAADEGDRKDKSGGKGEGEEEKRGEDRQASSTGSTGSPGSADSADSADSAGSRDAGGTGGAGGGAKGSATGKGGGGRPDLPGQGDPSASGAKRTAADRLTSGASGSGAGSGAGRTADAGGSGASGGPGGGKSSPSGGSESGTRPGGGGRNTGRTEERPVDGGMKTGLEKDSGYSTPETVDRKAVEDLDVTPEEVDRDRSALRASQPARRPEMAGGAGSVRRPRTDLMTDVGEGRRREVGPLASRGDRTTIPRDQLPSFEVVRSRPVSRAYRALVGEYFRRLRQLSSE